MAGLLRICTAGSVDDGKSTLIGRLLYDSQSLYEDQVRSVRAASRHAPDGAIEFALVTDGLRAEREQGITIDVAYRYFATPRRAFILADTPGHEQYTRNMATGASRADLAILLVDARHGVRDQTRRHARIADTLGVRRFVLAVNKMDLVGFDRGVFDAIRADFSGLLPEAAVAAIPVAALHGDNVIARSDRMPWHTGPSLLEYLETVDVSAAPSAEPFRCPVQILVRAEGGYRGLAGRIATGTVCVGDTVTAWPAGMSATVRRIVTWDGDLEVASAPASVTVVLDRELDVGRGDVLAAGSMTLGSRIAADVVWMDERPLEPGRLYLMKHTTRTMMVEAESALAWNELGCVTLATSQPLAFDPYRRNRTTGSFILIDPATNFTSGAGMIRGAADGPAADHTSVAERLVREVRNAASEQAAVQAVRRALERMLVPR